jgi:hypothetical protein
MYRQFEAIIFFLIAGFISSYFSKNMIIIMLVAILSTNFLIGTKLLGKVVKEGLEGLKKEEVKDASGNVIHDKKEVTEGDEKKTEGTTSPVIAPKPIEKFKGKRGEHFSTLSPASVNGEFIETKVDYASTLESAYDNLDKLLGSDAIRTMTEDTQRLAEKQKLLMGNIKQLQPMMQSAGKMLDGLNVGQMGDMLTGLEEKFKKFTGVAKPM